MLWSFLVLCVIPASVVFFLFFYIIVIYNKTLRFETGNGTVLFQGIRPVLVNELSAFYYNGVVHVSIAVISIRFRYSFPEGTYEFKMDPTGKVIEKNDLLDLPDQINPGKYRIAWDNQKRKFIFQPV